MHALVTTQNPTLYFQIKLSKIEHYSLYYFESSASLVPPGQHGWSTAAPDSVKATSLSIHLSSHSFIATSLSETLPIILIYTSRPISLTDMVISTTFSPKKAYSCWIREAKLLQNDSDGNLRLYRFNMERIHELQRTIARMSEALSHLFNAGHVGGSSLFQHLNFVVIKINYLDSVTGQPQYTMVKRFNKLFHTSFQRHQTNV